MRGGRKQWLLDEQVAETVAQRKSESVVPKEVQVQVQSCDREIEVIGGVMEIDEDLRRKFRKLARSRSGGWEAGSAGLALVSSPISCVTSLIKLLISCLMLKNRNEPMYSVMRPRP